MNIYARATPKLIDSENGYKDESGNWIIQPIFIKADEFDRGMARVLLDSKWCYIKEDGSWLVEPSFADPSP